MFLSAAIALALTIGPAAKQTPCHVIDRDELKEAQTLSQPCYAVRAIVTISSPITISPGTIVSFGEGAGLYVEEGGSLNAVGTAEKPIVFHGQDHSPGFWSGLNFQTNSSHNVLSYVTVEDAGEKNNDGAVVISVGARLAIDHTTIRNGAGSGLTTLQRGTISHFEANHFDGNEIPVSLKASDIAMLDTASTFTNNKHNYILVHSSDHEIESDSVWHALSLPYHIQNGLEVKANLVVEPGSRLEFAEGTGLNVEENGSLTAEGTPEKPIVFTATEDTPGFWDGIYIQSNNVKNTLRNVVVTYGGKTGGLAEANFTVSVRARATIQKSELAFSSTAAIVTLQGAMLNPDAEISNRLHDNAAGVVHKN